MGREIARSCDRPKHRTVRQQLSELGGHLAHSISTLRAGLLSDNGLCIVIPMAEIPCTQISAKIATFVFQEQLRSPLCSDSWVPYISSPPPPCSCLGRLTVQAV